MKIQYSIITILLFFVLNGCAVIPELKQQQMVKINNKIDNGIYQQEKWWIIFQDHQLNELINNVLENNKDILIAQFNIEKLNESINLQKNNILPQLDLTGFSQKQKLSEGGFYPPPLGGSNINFSQLNFNANVNFDLFGKNSYLVKEKEYQKESSELNKKALSFILIIQTLKLYGYWQYLNEQEILLNSQLLNQDKLINFSKERLINGITNKIEVLNLTNNLDLLKNELLDIKTNKEFVLEELNKLSGKLDSNISLSKSNVLNLVYNKKPLKNINSSIILQKPETSYYLFYIKSQEELLKSLKVDFYPSISLNGTAGFQQIGFSQLFKNGNIFTNLGPSINLPIFDAGRISTKYKIAGIDLNIFIENYNQSIIKSYFDLNNQIFKSKQLYESMVNQNKIFENEKEKFNLSKINFDLGKISKFELIKFENDFINNNKQNNNTQFSYFNSSIDLINAMGGNYKEMD